MSHQRAPGFVDSLAAVRIVAASRRDRSARQLALHLETAADRSAEIGVIRNRLNRVESVPEAGEAIDPVLESLRSLARVRDDVQLREAEDRQSAARRDVASARLALHRAQAGCDALAELLFRQIDIHARRAERQAAALADDEWLRRSHSVPWGSPWWRER